MASHTRVLHPCIEWILSQTVIRSSCLHVCLHELNFLFHMNELKILMKSSYERSVVLAYLMIQRQMLKVEVLEL